MGKSFEKIALFGSGGQLGTEIQRSAKAADLSLVAVSRTTADISDKAAVRALIEHHAPDAVVNAAAYTRVDDAEDHREAAEISNIIGPKVVAEVCQEAGIPIVHISSDYVFDGQRSGSYEESDPVSPIGYYGMTKARGEESVRNACPHHAIIRVSWLYGEFGQNFLKTMLRLAREREVIRVVADQYGSPTSTRDLAAGILCAIPQLVASPVRAGTYHFSGDGITTWHEFASAAVARFCDLSGRKVKVEPITTAEFPTKTKRPANSALNCVKFDTTFGFRRKFWRSEVEDITEILVRAHGEPTVGSVQ